MASVRKRTVTWTTRERHGPDAEKYEADYYDRTGKRHRRTFDLKKEAQRWLDEQTTGLVTGQWADPQAARRRSARTASGGWHARCSLPRRRRPTRSSCASTSSRPSVT